MAENTEQVRAAARKGILKTVWAILLVPALVYLAEVVKLGQRLKLTLLLGVSFLCVPFLTNLLELIAGVPFKELAGQWDSLQGWQRGVIGISVVVVLITFFIVVLGNILPFFIK